MALVPGEPALGDLQGPGESGAGCLVWHLDDSDAMFVPVVLAKNEIHI